MNGLSQLFTNLIPFSCAAINNYSNNAFTAGKVCATTTHVEKKKIISNPKNSYQHLR